jgi:hypothetical protein
VKVRYYSPFALRTGYAQAAHDYQMALLRAGVELDISPLNDVESPDDLEPRYRELADHVGTMDDAEITHQIVHTIPAAAHFFTEGEYEPPPHVRKVCFTTWETSKMPYSMVTSLMRAFHKVVVPSEWNRDILVESGMPDEKVAVVPHTYDPEFWRPADDDRWRMGWILPKPLNFYTIGVWGSRKNLVGTLVAYWHAFADPIWHDRVVLKVLCPPPAEGELETLIERCALERMAPVELITTPMSEAELVEFHRSSHCFVSTTRGEAWGLGAFEAAITGNMVVMPMHGGQRDFLPWGRFSGLNYNLTPVVPEVYTARTASIAGIAIRSVAKSAPTGLDATQLWAEPDMFNLIHSLRAIVDGRNHVPAYAGFDRFTYATVGPQFKRVLEEA